MSRLSGDGARMHAEAQDLIRSHIGHVHRVSIGFHFNANSPFSSDDLAAEGLAALVECAQRYDPSLGSAVAAGEDQFWAYAYPRVRGAMQDALRRWFHWDQSNHAPREQPMSLDEAIEHEVAVEDPPCTVDAWAALARLPERERNVVFRYACGESLTSIGSSLGVTESRACQIKGEAQARFRAWEYA